MQIKRRSKYSSFCINAKHSVVSIFFFIGIALLVILARLFLFEIYQIPSSSMSPTLEPGDYIIVCKMSYGPRVVNIRRLFKEKKLEYRWYKGWGNPQKGDVFVFNWPNYGSLHEEYPDMYGGYVVKRCLGIAGDTVIIGNKRINNEGIKKLSIENSYYSEMPDLFPHDNTLNWTIDNYGPLWVPGKGKSVKLTTDIAKHYTDVLLYEGCKSENRNDSMFLNSMYTVDYTFKENYYFMLGDNFYGSQDSRYWGFVPRKNIVGKTVLVLFSLDPDEQWYKKFRWKRVMKRIK